MNLTKDSPGFELHKLSTLSLATLPSGLTKPTYDRSRCTEGIVHIGVGGFHRSHQAVYLDDLMQNNQAFEWAICGVALLLHDEKIWRTLTEQDCLYTVVERSASGDVPRVIGSMKSFLWAQNGADKILAKMTAPETRIVSLTITEGGYCIDQTTGRFDHNHPDIQHDIKNPSAPRTAFGYIVQALAVRRKLGIKPFTVLSCDNLQGNGGITRNVVTTLASLIDQNLGEWISSNVAFPNSMVDRITPATTDAHRTLVAKDFGIGDGWPVVTEPFKQWIIEDTFCNGRPAFERVGAQFTTDVHPYEMMKIRLLNASHSAMGYLGYLAGFRYIHEIMADSAFRVYIRRFMDEEVTNLLKPVPGIELNGYKETLINRFANPTIGDQAARICMDGSNKLPKFMLASLREQLARGGQTKFMTLAIASWFRYLSATDEQGGMIVIEDPRAEKLVSAAQKGGKDPRPLLEITEVFGDLRTQTEWIKSLELTLQHLYDHGARATLTKWLAA